MEKCPECGKFSLHYNSATEMKRCFTAECNYEMYYCRHRFRIENNVLPKLVAKGALLPHKEAKCTTPKGWRECDTCELRA